MLILQVEAKLIHRLSLAIFSWTECLKGITMDGAADTTMDTTSGQSQIKLGGTPELEVIGAREKRDEISPSISLSKIYIPVSIFFHSFCRWYVMSSTLPIR